jgi:hypothetical protein
LKSTPGIAFCPGENQARSEMAGKSLLVAVIDAETFFCSPCLERFLDFCRSLPEDTLRDRVRGVLVFSSEEDQEESEIQSRIIAKKLRGFLRAQGIPFPVILDYSHIFDSLTKDAPCFLLLDAGRLLLKKYLLPLSAGQGEEIREALQKVI